MRRHPLVDLAALGILVGGAVVVAVASAGLEAWAWQTLVIAIVVGLVVAALAGFARRLTPGRRA